MIEVNRVDTFEAWRVKCNEAFKDLDEESTRIDNLETSTSSIVEKIGDMTELQTNSKDSVVNSINEIITMIGDLTTLQTSARDSIINAINELNTRIDNL